MTGAKGMVILLLSMDVRMLGCSRVGYHGMILSLLVPRDTGTSLIAEVEHSKVWLWCDVSISSDTEVKVPSNERLEVYSIEYLGTSNSTSGVLNLEKSGQTGLHQD